MNDLFDDKELTEKYRKICRSLICVTNRKLCSRPFAEQVERVCLLRPKAVILREKDLPGTDYEILAGQVLEICRKDNVPCILHSFPETAKRLDCRNIHLPLPLLEKYQDQLSFFDIIGSSVHSPEEAQKAESLGATYLSAGHVFTTDCKKGLPPRGLDFLRKTAESVSVPVYGIGGIKIDAGQLKLLLENGAAGGCVMSAMMKI